MLFARGRVRFITGVWTRGAIAHWTFGPPIARGADDVPALQGQRAHRPSGHL